jgi:6-phosphogluconolactonase/glucosamine-6-phosphate isomerase/deaminase
MAAVEDPVEGNPRITMNLSKRGMHALDLIVSVTGENKTDAVNAALRLYALVLEGGPQMQLFVRRGDGGNYERVHLL